MTKTKSLLGALCLALAPLSWAAPDPTAMDTVFERWDSPSTPGCALGVFRAGETLYARGYGMANLEYDIPNAPDSVFRIASTSKQFTALAMVLLEQQGKLSLDDDIRAFFPELPDYGAPVTVRQLIHHTSGIRDYLTLAWLADWPEQFSVDDALAMILRQQNLNFPPGSNHLYSNSGYFLMSQIVERVAGQSLQAFAEQHVFGPLGMGDTHFHDDHTHVVPRRADGYAMGEDGAYHISMTILDMVGDGGVYTTIEDFARWNANFADNRLGGGQALIETLETPGQLNDGTLLDYAIGLGVGTFSGTREISHGGAFVGYRAGFNRYPDHQLGVAVFCNDADSNPTQLARFVAALWLPAPGADEAELPAQAEAAAVDVPADALQRLVGEYLQPDDMMLRSIVLEDGVLFYDRGNGNRSALVPLGPSRFQMADVPITVTVAFSPAGQAPEQMTVSVEGDEPLTLERFQRATPSREELLRIPGAYYSEELDHTQVLTAKDGQLLAQRRNGVKVLEPLSDTLFVDDDGIAIELHRADDGTVTGFAVQAGRVRDLVYRRVQP